MCRFQGRTGVFLNPSEADVNDIYDPDRNSFTEMWVRMDIDFLGAGLM